MKKLLIMALTVFVGFAFSASSVVIDDLAFTAGAARFDIPLDEQEPQAVTGFLVVHGVIMDGADAPSPLPLPYHGHTFESDIYGNDISCLALSEEPSQYA
ncbi:MAG: hypothetical protein LBV27_08455 [Oscillospiraceae bacterium]|jgi:hypothetical protein|nr:hypothetical protein [Oscillospiraceae bacterium]